MATEAKTRGKPLMNPAIVRGLAIAAIAVMALAVIVDLVHGHASHFGFDAFPGFYALLGLAGGFVIIGVAKGLGAPLHRPDTYYGENRREAGK
jgi:hypothetical protein